MRYPVLFLLLLSIALPLHAQQTHKRDTVTAIKTTSGVVYLGSVIRETSDSIYFKTVDSVNLQLPRSAVVSVDYKAPKPPTHWSEFGGVFGTPAGLNFVVGAHWPAIGVRLSGAYWGHALSGIQVGIPYTFASNANTTHSVGLIAGTSFLSLPTTQMTYYGTTTTYTDNYWTSVGAAYDLNAGGFALQVGLTVGTGTFHNPQIAFQIGYVHENQ